MSKEKSVCLNLDAKRKVIHENDKNISVRKLTEVFKTITNRVKMKKLKNRRIVLKTHNNPLSGLKISTLNSKRSVGTTLWNSVIVFTVWVKIVLLKRNPLRINKPH